MSNNEFSLYVHIPFCVKKCFYCSFSVAAGALGRADEYLDMLARESSPDGTVLSTVYVGGGTPSCLSSDQVRRLFDTIRRRFVVVEGAEITLEANPESVDDEKCLAWHEAGINRISLGVQSLQDATLARLGRPHRADDVRRAVEAIRRSECRNLNVDVITALPWETPEQSLADIDQIFHLESEHVSLYALNIEDKSLFSARGVKVDEEMQARVYLELCARLRARGYEQYEVSNFAKSGFASKHNIHYWMGGEYIGLGMAAHSHLKGERSWNASALTEYMTLIRTRGEAKAGSEKLPPAEKFMETFLFGLRMNQGVDLHVLEQRFGLELSLDRREILESFIEMGLLEESGVCVRATDRGRLLLDEICARLI